MRTRALDLDNPADVALGRALVQEYVTFTIDEAVRVLGEWPAGDRGDIDALIPDLRDFSGRYRDGAFLAAFANDVAVGGVGITRIDALVCEMNRLWLRPALHGAGNGRALVAACVDHARSMGYKRMVLDAASYRDRAITLYRSFGFDDAPPIHEYPFEMVALGLDL
jgi:GNAT superfamily N-acetyltransferase